MRQIPSRVCRFSIDLGHQCSALSLYGDIHKRKATIFFYLHRESNRSVLVVQVGQKTVDAVVPDNREDVVNEP